MGGFLSITLLCSITIVIDPTIINVCLTNIDVVDGIDCLQVLQHSSGSDHYLRVATGKYVWLISDDIDGNLAWIQSASAGGICPAQASNSHSDRTGVKSWRYAENGVLKEGIINVKCLTHTFYWTQRRLHLEEAQSSGSR